MELTHNLPDGLGDLIFQYSNRPMLVVDGETSEITGINQAGADFFATDTDLKGVFWPGILNLLNLSKDVDLQAFGLLKPGAEAATEAQRVEKFMYIDQENSSEKYLQFQMIRPPAYTNQWVIIIEDKTAIEHYVQSRSDFVTMASHQLRTPLAGMKWNIDLFIKRYKGDLSSQQLHILGNASLSIDRMNEMIKALLQLSRIETGTLKLKPRYVEIHQLLKDIVKAHTPHARQRNIQLITSFHNNLPETFLDGTLIGFVFENLISNAIKYSNDNSEVTIFLSRLEEMALLQVTDSGIGIPRDHQSMIFEKFYRDSNAIQHAPDGTGLGLHLCRIIAHRSGGDIWFKSEVGKGSSFWFTIPLHNDKIAVDESSNHKI